ncbi:SRPBCC family protein [Paenarthrobacter sp. DKR-5]|uniref:SRPBCC family protein n=1 Tax=Paenarthrobacter sp. DKR-5 TaxID=2835535 RepID=UPI001BDCE017|nr:SRPBCC family protein [Paenarthrobacter sp. DKR-5]MBT1001750.1 SRPBCC family protein [Paenarthrobacter sp. DKR-5]
MAKNLMRSVTINAPAEKVFTFLSDPAHWMMAFPGDSEVTEVDIKPDGVGTSARWSAKMFGVTMFTTHEYREVVPDRRIVSKASVGPVLTFSLEPVADGTQLSVEQSFDIQAPFVRVPVQVLFARWTEDDIEGLVANIKSLVEAGQKTFTGKEKAKVHHTLTWSDAISIDAPVQRVFDLVKDPKVWLGPDVQVSNLNLTPQGVGTTFEAAWKVLGIPLKTTHEYTEFVPNEHFTSKAALGPVFNVAVSAENGGTRLSMRSDVVPANWAEAAVDSLVIKMSEHSQADLLASIKTFAEAGGAQS